MGTNYLKELGPDLIKKGYRIAPVQKGDKHPGVVEWQNLYADASSVETWLNEDTSKRKRNKNPYTYISVVTGEVSGIDIDVTDAEIADKICNYCFEKYGVAPKRVGRAPRVLLAYQAETPFPKKLSKSYIDLFGEKQQIEVLGDGQQFLAYAEHPKTSKPYRWVDGPGLSDIPISELPVISEQDAIDLIEYFESIIPADWELINKNENSNCSTTLSSSDLDEWSSVTPKVVISKEEVLESLEIIKDYAEDRNSWLNVGRAIHHQFDGSEEGLEIWDKWSENGSSYNDGIDKPPREKWKEFKSIPIGKRPTTFAYVLGLKKVKIAKSPIQELKGGDQKFKILHATDVLAKLGPIDWRIEDFLEKDSTGLIFGEPGSFKSFIALDMGFHVAAGRSWHGRKVQQGPVIYLAGEGHNGLARRLAAWSSHHDIQFEDLPFYISETAASLCDKLSVLDVMTAVKSIADQFGNPSMIIIDTLARNFGPGDENSTTDMSTFIDHVDSVLRHEFGATVCLVHHSGHSNKERARGSAALKAGLDFEYRVEKIKGSFNVSLTNTKMKNAPEHTEATWFEGKEVFFGDFEDNISSLVFEISEAPITEEKPLKGKQAKLFELIFSEGPVERETLREIAIEEGIFDNSDQFKRTAQELKKKERIKEIDNRFSILDEFSENGHETDIDGHF